MKVTSFRRATASITAALLVGFGFVLGFAPTAQAHHNSINATVECGYAPNTWVIRWSVQNSEANKSETITASSDPALVSVGTVIAPGATLTARQNVDSPRDHTLEVTAEWDTGFSNTNKGFVSQSAFPLDCWDGGGSTSITYCHQGNLTSSTQLQFYQGGHLQHDADIYPGGSFTLNGESHAWEAHGDQDLMTSGCTSEPFDECSELPGVQPPGFACTKDPTIRRVERSEDGCAVGGVRSWTDAYTTAYTFTNGEWVASPESGPVRENETFTPYTAQELIDKGCETTVVTTPSILVVDACGVADDSVTLSKSDHYTGVDNGDGTATFTTATGFVFETAGGEVTELTLTYALSEVAPCVAIPAKATTTPPSCEEDGTLVIPEQPKGVKVTPAPGVYGPGRYRVTFTAARGYELANDPSDKYKIGKAVNNVCPADNPADSPDLPNTGANAQPVSTNPNAANPNVATTALPDTGLSNQTSVVAGVGVFALIAGLGMLLFGQARARRGVV